jgi:hypothetical protein
VSQDADPAFPVGQDADPAFVVGQDADPAFVVGQDADPAFSRPIGWQDWHPAPRLSAASASPFFFNLAIASIVRRRDRCQCIW